MLIVEPDCAVARQAQLCLSSAGYPVASPLTTLTDALRWVEHLPPHVIVMDVAMLGDDEEAGTFAEAVRRHAIPVVYLSASADQAWLERAATTNAAAYILTPFADRQLVSAVVLATIAAERAAFPLAPTRPLTQDEKFRAIAALVNDTPAPVAPAVPPTLLRPQARALPSLDVVGASLSTREREIVELLLSGARVSTIARNLQLSPHTVRNHLKSVFRKLNVHGQAELFEFCQNQTAN